MEETTLPEFDTIFATNHRLALKFLGTKLLFHGGTKSYFKVGQVRQLFIANFLFKSGPERERVISKWVIVYVKVRQNLFQSRKIISRSIALQSYDLEKSKT